MAATGATAPGESRAGRSREEQPAAAQEEQERHGGQVDRTEKKTGEVVRQRWDSRP